MDVYRLLTDDAPVAPGALAAALDSPGPQPPADDGASKGPADKRFRDPAFVSTHLATRSETVRGAATHLASKPGEWLTTEEIAEALDLPYGWNSLAGAFGAAGRYWGNRDIGMPWSWTYETPDRHVELMMDAETASTILATL